MARRIGKKKYDIDLRVFRYLYIYIYGQIRKKMYTYPES